MKHLFGLLFALLFTINGAAAQSADAVFYMEMDTLGGGIRAGQEYDLYYKSRIPFDSVSPPAFDARIEVVKGPCRGAGAAARSRTAGRAPAPAKGSATGYVSPVKEWSNSPRPASKKAAGST